MGNNVVLPFSHSRLLFLLLSDRLSVSPPFTQLSHSFKSPGLRGLTEHRGWAVQTPWQCKGEEKEAEMSLETTREGCVVFVSLCVYWWGKYNCHISPCWATSSRINTRIMQLLTVDKNYTGRDKSRGRRHRGADWKWKQDWGEPKGQDVWIYVTGKCEGMKVWGDGSLVFHNCGICAGQ